MIRSCIEEGYCIGSFDSTFQYAWNLTPGELVWFWSSTAGNVSTDSYYFGYGGYFEHWASYYDRRYQRPALY